MLQLDELVRKRERKRKRKKLKTARASERVSECMCVVQAGGRAGDVWARFIKRSGWQWMDGWRLAVICAVQGLPRQPERGKRKQACKTTRGRLLPLHSN